MDVRTNCIQPEPVTPGLSFETANYWRTEDSGYHSFTPGSLQCTELSSDTSKVSQRKISITGQIHVDSCSITPEIKFRSLAQYTSSTSILRSCENFVESPVIRRGVKRLFQEEDGENIFSPENIFPTPTSVIAGGLRKLKFNEGSKLSTSLTYGNLYYHGEHTHTSYPTTPIKKVCRSSCKLSSPLKQRKLSERFNFITHSLSCDTEALEPLVQPVKPQRNLVQSKFRPGQRIDIIKSLYQDAHAMPPITKIFSYLSNKDIYNFRLVSQTWLQVWDNVSKIKSIQLEYTKFLKEKRENQENKNIVPKNNDSNHTKPLVEIHNLLSKNTQIGSVVSPPGTPKTTKFKKYAKSASLDIRMQLSCVRCDQPAKATEDCSGEEWFECTSSTCSYQFCRLCRCDRHPGKNCFQYDLSVPTPPKRKKTMCAVGTKKSRRNLRRLL